MSSLPLLLALGAISLFAVGYVAHSIWGDNNVVEEVAEELLEQEYHIEVEFTENKNT